jgi:NADH-quinone oxidoreductase subunit A
LADGARTGLVSGLSRESPVPTGLPTSDFLAAHASVLVFLVAIVGLLLFVLVLWKVLRPARFSEEKLTTYECGEEPTGNAWIQFNIRFYVFALIFIVFDVEAVFLLPWATVFRELGALAYVEGLVFIGILVVALGYVWRKGDLAWVRADERT